MNKTLHERLLREPLLHFAVIGGLIFLLYSAVAGPGPEPADSIVIGPERIEQLKKAYEAVWRRAPTDDEVNSMVDDHVREEVYYREALALGLDRDDTVIRRRLRQKMEFLTDTGADALEPKAGELEAWFARNKKSYSRQPRVAFEQVLLGQNPNAEAVAQTLSKLQAGQASDWSAIGERTLLPAQLDLSPPDVVDGVFGKDFFQQLETLPVGKWSGPAMSGYGMHLVRMLDNSPASTPPLEEVRDAVLQDWRAAMALELSEQHYAKLRARYTVEIRDGKGSPEGAE